MRRASIHSSTVTYVRVDNSWENVHSRYLLEHDTIKVVSDSNTITSSRGEKEWTVRKVHYDTIEIEDRWGEIRTIPRQVLREEVY